MIYTVHLNRDALKPDQQGYEDRLAGAIEVFPESSAKWAIVFPPLWLLVHKLWWPLVFYCAVSILLLALLATPVAVSVLFLGGLPGIYLFLEGHQLRRQKLDEKGFEHVGVVEASSAESAVERFISQSDFSEPVEPKPNGLTVPTRIRPHSKPTFGLFADHGN